MDNQQLAISETTRQSLELLEEKIAYQERTIEILNDTVTAQQRQLQQLQHELSVLSQFLKEWRKDNAYDKDGNNGNSIASAIAHEIPPHY